MQIIKCLPKAQSHYQQRRQPLPPVVYIYTPFFSLGREMSVDYALRRKREFPGWPWLLGVSKAGR